MNGEFILIDKPKGMSSFGVIARLRKELGIRKIGHAGTLDPNATGLLVVAAGVNTKRIKDIVGLPKIYEAEILLGVKTDTGDIDGAVIETKDIPEEMDIQSVLKEMEGNHILPVPLYSAMKQGGESLYKKARRGESFIVPKREMEVREALLVSVELPSVFVRFDVGSGTYIRSLAEEFGRKLNTVATLKELRRTKVGEFKVEDARSI